MPTTTDVVEALEVDPYRQSWAKPTSLPRELETWLKAKGWHPCWVPSNPDVMNWAMGSGYRPLRWRELTEALGGEESEDLMRFQEGVGSFVQRGSSTLCVMPKAQKKAIVADEMRRTKAMAAKKFQRDQMLSALSEVYQNPELAMQLWEEQAHRGIAPELVVG